jgi:hypothetical protein
MAFQLDHQAATLKSVTIRKEAHGDSKVTAVSFGLKFTAPNTLLDHLSPTLRTTLYKPAAIDGQEPLEGVDEPTPLLRQPGIEMLSLKGELNGWTVMIDHGIDEADPMTFGGCKIDGFKVAPLEGGTVELHARVGTSDIDPAEIGILGDKLQEEVVVTITAPKPMERPIDGSTEAFQKDHPGADTQPDLLDGGDDRDDAATRAFLGIHADEAGPPDSDTDSGGTDGEGSDPDIQGDGRTELPRTVKYRQPTTGETWSGRGNQPRWVKAAIAAGRSLEEFAA